MMRTEEHWRWRIKWGGRWKTTRITYTEEHIRKEHPEAIRIEGSLVVQQIGHDARVMVWSNGFLPSGWPRWEDGQLKAPAYWTEEERVAFSEERQKDRPLHIR